MAVTLVNATGYTFGVPAAETGVNVESIEFTVKPEFKEYLMNRQNEKIGYAIADPETEITVQGEISGTTGLMAATFASTITLANDVTEFGSTGAIKLDEATVTISRNGWKKVSMKLSRNGNLT